ncbi:MAG TPA: ATP-binding cassette domain-containing protein [Polyangiaceae bacterium]|nr:ATP-binding cassette domain-containing protein [Polyangiaceae bacterium]
MNGAPLIAARDLRVDVDGAVSVDGIAFETRGASAAIVGDGSSILSALQGKAEIRAGTLRVDGADVARREHTKPGAVGVAPLDPPLPPRWTAREYLMWGARLCGANRSDAQERAARVLSELELAPLAWAKLEGLAPFEKRALVIAQAIVTGPAVLVAAAPLCELSGPDADYVAKVFATATHGRKWIVTLTGLYAGSSEHHLAAAADELLVFASGRLVRQGKLQKIEGSTVGYTLMLRGNVAEFREAIRALGVELSGGPQRYFVDLPEGVKTHDLLAASAKVGAPIVELVPRILLEPSRFAPSLGA